MIGWFVETLLAASMLMALVLMLRGAVARHLGAGAAYALWLLPFLRMLLPPLPTGGGVAAAAVLPASMVPDSFARGGPLITPEMMATPVAAGGAPVFPWVEALIILWAAGATAFLVAQVVGYWRFSRLMRVDGTLLRHEAGIAIIESAHAAGPLAFGVLRRFIVLPVDFGDRYDPAERAMALAHERAHHERGDLAANMAALLVLGLHWCNPVAWIAYRAFRADQELACDARVMARNADADMRAYGRAILKAASGRHFAAACHLTTIDNLKGRLTMLTAHQQSLHRITWGMAAVAVATVSGLALTASGSRAAQQVAALSEKMEGARISRLAAYFPQTPAAPATVSATVPTTPAAPDAPQAPASADATAAPMVPAAPAAPAAVSSVAPAAAALPAPLVPQIPPVPVYDAHRHVPQSPRAPAAPQAPNWSGVPTAAQIEAMVPQVTVERTCEGDGSVDVNRQVINGREQVRIRMCQRDFERHARHSAIRNLEMTRARIAHNRSMPDMTRADILAELDQEIGRLRDGQD